VRSAHGICTKVVTISSVESIKQKVPVLAAKRPIGQKLAAQRRSEQPSAGEIRALTDIQNHRPVPGSMHTKLWLKGLAQFDDGQWVLTDKGEAIINRRETLISARTVGNNPHCAGVGDYARYCPP
jgi:hypothetical protein